MKNILLHHSSWIILCLSAIGAHSQTIQKSGVSPIDKVFVSTGKILFTRANFFDLRGAHRFELSRQEFSSIEIGYRRESSNNLILQTSLFYSRSPLRHLPHKVPSRNDPYKNDNYLLIGSSNQYYQILLQAGVGAKIPLNKKWTLYSLLNGGITLNKAEGDYAYYDLPNSVFTNLGDTIALLSSSQRFLTPTLRTEIGIVYNLKAFDIGFIGGLLYYLKSLQSGSYVLFPNLPERSSGRSTTGRYMFSYNLHITYQFTKVKGEVHLLN